MDDQGQRLVKAAQDGNIDKIYALVREDPNLLESVNKIPFIDTPLHIAAAAGHIHFAVEIASLKPSFCRKLNPDGFSPLHLALQNGHTELVKRLVSINGELVRVQGKERITPLHYVAELGDTDLLAEFLCACPKSIEDLTIRSETVVHIAVKKKNSKAFKVLFEWLRRTNKKEVLNWKDEEGNTVLHIAAYTNQPEVMEELIKKVNKNDKNSKGLTALDIVSRLPLQEVDEKEVKDISCHAGAKEAKSPHDVSSSLADLLSKDEKCYEKWLRYTVHRHREMSDDLRNVILVVAVLVATASYQAVLSPPGGIGDNNNSSQPRVSGKSVMAQDLFFVFSFLNTTAFATSMAVIVVVFHIQYFSMLLHISLVFLMSSYVVSLYVISPLTNMAAKFFMVGPHAFFFGFIFTMRLWIFVRDEAVLFWRKGGRDKHPRYHQMKWLVSEYSLKPREMNRAFHEDV